VQQWKLLYDKVRVSLFHSPQHTWLISFWWSVTLRRAHFTDLSKLKLKGALLLNSKGCCHWQLAVQSIGRHRTTSLSVF
jgi:hypothetical protein